MYFKVKNTIFCLFYGLLLLRFIFLIGDPRVYGGSIENSWPIYAFATGLVDLTYLLTNVVVLPMNLLFGGLFLLVPVLRSDFFPALPAPDAVFHLQTLTQSHSPWWLPEGYRQQVLSWEPEKTFPGVFDWMALMALTLMAGSSPFIDRSYETIRNLLWNIFIEVSFTKKKQAMYQEALEKRSADLMRLNIEYRNLSKEASQLKDSVMTDELTQVFNKRFFIQKIQELFMESASQKSTLGLIMMDIDHFKKLNDTYGHLVGDDVLKAVSGLAKQVTPNGSYLCRFGGEEFALMMPNGTEAALMVVAEQIKSGIPQLTFPVDPNLRVTISQGVASVNFSNAQAKALDSFEKLIKLADDELYRAKLEGRDRICHYTIA